MVTRRYLLCALPLLAGCTSTSQQQPEDATGMMTTASTTASATSSTSTPTMTPFPDFVVSLPDGPRDPPPRPDELTETSVRDYVETYEYRYVYNHLSRKDGTPTVSSSVNDVLDVPVGWAVGVQARGHVNYGGTTTVHADFGGHPLTYFVDENSTIRLHGQPEDHIDTTTTVD